MDTSQYNSELRKLGQQASTMVRTLRACCIFKAYLNYQKRTNKTDFGIDGRDMADAMVDTALLTPAVVSETWDMLHPICPTFTRDLPKEDMLTSLAILRKVNELAPELVFGAITVTATATGTAYIAFISCGLPPRLEADALETAAAHAVLSLERGWRMGVASSNPTVVLN